MDLKTFISLYKNFLHECEQNDWHVTILVKKFGHQLASISNKKGIEVQFFFEIDLEHVVKLSESKNQSMLKYGVIRQKGEADVFAKEVLDAFHQHLAKHQPKQKTKLIYYIP